MNLRKQNLGKFWKKLLGGGGLGAGGMVQIFFWNLTHFFDLQFRNTFNLIFLDFKVPSESFFSQEFQNRSYFLTYLVLKNRKLSPKLSAYQWDTLYMLCTLPKSWLRDSWNLAATVGVLGFMVMNWPLGLCITRAVSLRLCKSKNILEINLSLELMSRAITSYLKIKINKYIFNRYHLKDFFSNLPLMAKTLA